MTDYFVGPGGNDGNDGLTWANRFLTLNAAEDEPVVPGDFVYVGPGAYREELIVDVSGTATGGPITYIADVTGENTDGIGGVVRITGSDNDTSGSRGRCINSSSAHNYRTFRGFRLDMSTQFNLDWVSGTNLIMEDCVSVEGAGGTSPNFYIRDAAQADHIFRRCLLGPGRGTGITFEHSSAVDNTDHLVENCLFIGNTRDCIAIDQIGNITIKNSTFIGGGDDLIDCRTALTAGQTTTVNNCIFVAASSDALEAQATGQITEDYNTFYRNQTDRNNVAVGGNSVTYPPLWDWPLLFDGIKIPWDLGSLNEWSQVARIAGTGESADDIFGVVRPTTSAKKSFGAFQLREPERETGTVQTGSAALTLADAGDHQIYVPVTATSTTFEVAARYESEYAGTLPRLIVRQPGQADQVDTMVAAADTWETLSLTFTPNATPPYVVIIFRSLNTSVTGDFDTYWDDLDVS